MRTFSSSPSLALPIAIGRVMSIALALVSFASPSQAVVVSNTLENTSAPDDDPGFANVGIVGGSAGVYIGDRWVITAAHVPVTNIEFPDLGIFEPVEGSKIQLKNVKSSLTTTTDLMLFQLTEEPDLPSLTIADTTPPIGSEVLMIGRGRARDPELTYWDVDKRTNPWTWTESDTPTEYSGFQTLASHSIRWGTNRIEGDEPHFFEFDSDELGIIETRGHVEVFTTVFNSPDDESPNVPLTDFESQAVKNDSGGAVFYKLEDEWQLAGIMISVDGHSGQPNETLNAIYDNLTFSADLATYRSQIIENAVTVIFGDFNGDGMLNVADIELLGDAVFGDGDPATFDLNDDGTVNSVDHEFWVSDLAKTYFGDSNFDGEFNSSDLINVFIADEYEDGIDGNSTWVDGDWNGDRDFDSRDLILAFQHNGYEMGLREDPFVAPEPRGLTLTLISALILVLISRRRF